MNRVQTVTQNQYRVEKPGRKPSQMHEHQKLAQLGTQDRTGARMLGRVVGATAVSWPSYLVVSWPAWPYRSAQAAVSQRAGCRVAARRLPCRSAQATMSQRAGCSVAALTRAPCRAPSAQRLRRVLGWLCCIATQPSRLPLPPVTIHLGVLRYNAQPF